VPLLVAVFPPDLGRKPVAAVPPATPRGLDAVLAREPVAPLTSLTALP
jgi:hypothetical protein